METVDYSQTAEDHQTFLVLIKPTGKLLSWKHFSRCWDRICQLDCVAVPGQKRDMYIRYKRAYTKESNEWGDFQAHRKAMGLISIGRCSTEAEFEELFESYKKEKERYADTLYNSRLVVFGMNTDGTEINEQQQKSFMIEGMSPPLTFKIDSEKSETTDRSDCDKGDGTITPENKKSNGQVGDAEQLDDPLRKSLDENTEMSKKVENGTGSPKKELNDTSSQITFIRQKTEKVDKSIESVKQSVTRTPSNNSLRDKPGSEVVFYPSVDMCDGLEESVREFVTSLFFVLEGKRLDRSFERLDKSQLLCAPFEKKDFVGVDPDTKSYKKKCQGRLRKHLADLSLLAGLPGEAMLHYSTAIDILKPVNDWLWMAGCYEGLCAASVVTTLRNSQMTTIRRNQSFSVKRGVAGLEKPKPGSKIHSYSNGLQELPEVTSKSGLNPDDMIEKYKDALMFYSKYKNAAVIEMEASFKACRVLLLHRKYLQASDFLQNVVYINLQLSDEDRINRYSTLSTLYAQIGFKRKASFFKRVAAMQCVAPQNPKPNWVVCHQLLVQALEGYRIYLDPSDSTTKPGYMNGWPVLQMRVLHELIYSARRMGNVSLAIRYMTILLHTQLQYMTVQEKRELVASLENFTSQHEGTTQPLALDSGVIVPHVPLLTLPLVKSFKLMPLQNHLEPKKLQSVQVVPDNVFIFTPLNIGATDTGALKTHMDFKWVEGDMAEVQLQVSNPMPDELKLSQITLITEGVEIESVPTAPSIPAESGSYLVKILVRPTSTGDLKILGYSTKVYGAKSNCRLRDCATFPESFFTVTVIPALPQINLTSSLPKSANFLSFGEEFNMVTSATAVLYMGQSSECTVTLQNSGKLPVELVNVSLESTRDNKDYVCDVFKWNKENIDSQLPLQVSQLLCFNLAINAVGEFLLSSKGCVKTSSDSLNRGISLEGKVYDVHLQVVETILKVEYSGRPGVDEEFCRCCSIAFSVDILPSVVFHKWDVMLSESSDHCYLLFDLQNISDHDLEIHHSNQCVYLKHEQIKRICIEIERSEPKLFDGDVHSSVQFSQFLATFVDIRWEIVSFQSNKHTIVHDVIQKVWDKISLTLVQPSLSVSGKVCIDNLLWTPEQQQLVYISPVSWDVRLNGQLISPLHIGSLEYKLGQMVKVDVEVNVKPESDLENDDAVLTVYCCQHCDNGTVNYNTDNYVCTIGSQALVIPKISVEDTISHSCMFMFTCSGFYKFEIKMLVKGQAKGKGQGHSEVKVESLPESRTYKCSSVIEVNIVD
ncbi:trafficking protein particle complex subunit 9-like [Ruditapes philippinarum]|uniref:trafficking protein particle complex subunit 9-like n=1 Tax=Ruditapes philippinarum TaxID=129788 RepID=UPI00295B89EF|nr:trafficking protein particle complex subunit 9-like [Ruditapes philippinarum]